MANLQLERRALKRKAISEFTLPEMPKLPGWFVRKFGIEEYEQEWERWRQRAQSNIREALLNARSDSTTTTDS